MKKKKFYKKFKKKTNNISLIYVLKLKNLSNKRLFY